MLFIQVNCDADFLKKLHLILVLGCCKCEWYSATKIYSVLMYSFIARIYSNFWEILVIVSSKSNREPKHYLEVFIPLQFGN